MLPEAEILESLHLFNQGTALLEQYRYGEAAEILRKVVHKFPDWTAAKFNLALAYINLQETKGALDHLAEGRKLLEEILAEQPDHLHARFSLGLLFEHIGQHEQALECFRQVYQADPKEPAVLYKYAEALLILGHNEEGTLLLEELVSLDPGFISGVYRLAMQYQRMRDIEKAKPLFARFRQLNAAELAGGSFAVRKVYGSAGKYYWALGPDNLPLPRTFDLEQSLPLFDPEVTELGQRDPTYSVKKTEVLVPPLALGDWNKDGLIDIGTGGEQGKVFLYLNRGNRLFEERVIWEEPVTQLIPADVNNDGFLDLWLAGAAGAHVLLGDDQGQFQPQLVYTLPSETEVVFLSRLVDIDADGDLDMLLLVGSCATLPCLEENHSSRAVLLVNRRDGTFDVVTDEYQIGAQAGPVGALLFEDFDGDRDIDWLLWPSSPAPPKLFINDRIGAVRLVQGESTGLKSVPAWSATTADIDKNQLSDIVVCSAQGTYVFFNKGSWQFTAADEAAYPFLGLSATTVQSADLDNDGDLDILFADASKNRGSRPRVFINLWPQRQFADLDELPPGNLLTALQWPGRASGLAADLDNDGAVDLVFAPAGNPTIVVWGIPSGRNWIQIDLVGTEGQDQKTRSAASAIGSRLEVKTGAIWQQYIPAAPTGPTAVAPLRIHAGLGGNTHVDWLRVIWPDGVLQAEVEVPANQRLVLEELQRKISSCPHLFAWTGEHFSFVSDFGGKGGLGYWIAPGKYAYPQPTELLPVPQLQPKEGFYILKILEPLEEVVYVDQIALLCIEHNEQTVVLPHELMAVSISPPPPEVVGFRRILLPVYATDISGREVTARLQNVDRDCVGPITTDRRFTGFAERHLLEIVFDPAELTWKEQDRVFLIAHGWVNYAYSSTNFAAHQAGLRLQAPTISVLRDGDWVPIVEEAGYPAGINHVMLLELTGLLRPGDARLRIETNMEIYWDQVSLGIAEEEIQNDITVLELTPARAQLEFVGFPREYSPDGRKPNLFDYSNIDKTSAWKRPVGYYTRFGEVTPLILSTDNAFVIMGPGEELTVEFAVPDTHPSAGRRRTFILKTVSFCKDMDWHTAYGQTVEPLPFHGMSRYPYGPDECYPNDPTVHSLHEIFNTRFIGPK